MDSKIFTTGIIGLLLGNIMESKNSKIVIDADKVNNAISLLGDLKKRVRVLDADKDKIQGDSGYMYEAIKEYDVTLSKITFQMETLIQFTQSFLKKASSDFVHLDENIADELGK